MTRRLAADELVQAVHDALNLPEEPQLRTLVFAIGFPGEFDPADLDAETCAHEFVDMLNEERQRTWLENGGNPDTPHGEGRLMVSLIPGPQWITPNTMSNLRTAAAGSAAVLAAVPDGWRKEGGEWVHRDPRNVVEQRTEAP